MALFRANPDDLTSSWTLIGPNYFHTMGIPLLRGREIDAADAARAMQVAVVNESFVKFFFPNSDPIGKHVTDEYPTTRETYEIVGVVPDVKEHSLRPQRDRRFYANIFHPIGTVEDVTLLLSSTGDPASDCSLGPPHHRRDQPGFADTERPHIE